MTVCDAPDQADIMLVACAHTHTHTHTQTHARRVGGFLLCARATQKSKQNSPSNSNVNFNYHFSATKAVLAGGGVANGWEIVTFWRQKT